MAQTSAVEKRVKKFATEANADNRQGMFWTPEEDTLVKTEFLRGVSIDQIAAACKRTSKAIELRLAKYAAEEVGENPDQGKITATAARWRVTESMVKANLKKKLQPRMKKADLEARIVELEAQVAHLQQQLAGRM